MPEPLKIKHREMGDQAISQSFRGILRVAGIQELAPGTDDVYFDSRYYGQMTGGIASQEFCYDSAYPGISGSLKRYSSTDAYKSRKVPVTDSLGFYLNMNLGAESSTIGSDPSNNGNNADKETFYQTLSPQEVEQDVIFPVLESKELIIGFEPIKASEYKSHIVSGSISLDTSDTPANIITYNNYNHSPSNIKNDTFQKITGTINRTIIRDSNSPANDFDVLMHKQDNIDNHNLTKHGIVDAFVEVVNLKDYIKQKLSVLQQDNVDEVLTGTIVEQYVDLNKWYCSSDSTNYAGHNPPLNRPEYSGELSPSIYQNASVGANRISSNLSVTGTGWEQAQLDELVPLYKRDYLLCDGSTYNIYLSTVSDVNNLDYISFNRFFNLFFCIEYKYTDRKNIKKHYVNKKTTKNDGTVVYDFVLSDGKKVKNEDEVDKEVLFAIDVVSALAFKTIWNNMLYGTDNNSKSSCLNPTTNMYDKDLAEAWLKKQKLPEQYIFNTPIPSEQGGIKYKYVTAPIKAGQSGKEIEIEIGREVNSFSSLLWYYDCEDQKYVAVEVWKISEVQAVLNLFTKFGIAREKELKEDYVFSFQVPDFKIEADKYSVGGMIGSSPYYWSDDAVGETKTSSVCAFDDGQIPHRHYILEGSASDSKNSGATQAVTSTTMAKGEGPWKVGAQFDGWCVGCNWNDRLYNYVFCELSNTKYSHDFISGLNVSVIQMDDVTKSDDPDPRFRNAEPDRGMTSTPIVVSTRSESKFTQASANTTIGSAEFFSPETIQIMALIKI